jgi:hypothetical protein
MSHTSHLHLCLIAQARETLPINEMLLIVAREVIVEDGELQARDKVRPNPARQLNAREAWYCIPSAYFRHLNSGMG